MATQTDKSATAEIRAVIDAFTRAARDRDIDGIAAHYAPDVRAFDAIRCLEFRGRDVYMKHWAECVQHCNGPMVFDMDHLEIAVSGDLAFSHALCKCGGQDESGELKTSWLRVTQGFRRVDGRWRIVHEHFSLPFDMQTGQMLTDLKP